MTVSSRRATLYLSSLQHTACITRVPPRALHATTDGYITWCRIENGDSKPRVRALEVERAMQRMETSQTLLTCLVVASMFVNVGTVLSVSALPLGSTLSFVAGGACALVAMVNFLKLKQAQKKEAQILGAA